MAGTVKRSITLDEDLDRELNRRFGPGERSRFLNDAAREALARDRLRDLLASFDEEYGPVPQEIVDEVARLPRPR